MAWLVAKFGPTAAKVIFWVAVALLAIALLGTAKCAYDQRAKTEVKLAKGQAGAAVASGSDAVETLGNQQAAEVAADAITKENGDAIRNAQGADAPVNPAVRDAGFASLCRRAAYHSNPKCVQHAPPH